MKISGSKKKKGVSAVVATILIVMITVLAIGIIWVTILPMIRENLAVSDVCENAGVSIVSSQGYTCYKPSNITMVQVSKGNSEVNVTGLKFSVSMDGNSYDYDNQKVEYSTADYNVYYLNTSEFEKIEKISVVPTIKLGDSDKSCSAIFLDNVPLCSSNINLVAVSAGKLIGRSSGYSTNAQVVAGCVANNSCAQNICTNVNCTDICGNNYTGLIELNCSCAANTFVGQNCSDGCGGICAGLKQLGDGSVKNPYQITSWIQLNNTRNNLTASYILMNDLDKSSANYSDYAGPSANGGLGWEPIGNNTAGSRFTGNFNGNNHIIYGLYINRSDYNEIGLFGVSNGGNISNIGLVDVNITGYSKVGGLVGYISVGNINNSYSSGDIVSFASSGGLVGINDFSASIYNSYSTVDIISVVSSGGLVGENKLAASIYNSYSTGSVTGTDRIGGLVGNQVDGTTSSSYWDVNTSGQLTSAGGIGKTTSEMKNISTFLDAGWSKYNAWAGDEGIWYLEHRDYPRLGWEIPLEHEDGYPCYYVGECPENTVLVTVPPYDSCLRPADGYCVPVKLK